VDELRNALELATDEELQDLTEILFRPKFNPLDYLNGLDPLDVHSLKYYDRLDALEDRFRYLAADGMTVLQGRGETIPYRDILIRICRHLRVPYELAMGTEEIESEIFLHLLQRAWKKLPPKEQQSLSDRVQRSISHHDLTRKLPVALQRDPMVLLLLGGSAIAVNSMVRPLILQLIARQFALHYARHEVAKQTLAQGGLALGTHLRSQVSLKMAQHGMAATAARYGATRSVLAWVGPAMWAWFFADLGWRSIDSNYGRVVPVVFVLAQIRLTRQWNEVMVEASEVV
jgi:uncharacterized protein YaaW (UPF0174 family)